MGQDSRGRKPGQRQSGQKARTGPAETGQPEKTLGDSAVRIGDRGQDDQNMTIRTKLWGRQPE